MTEALATAERLNKERHSPDIAPATQERLDSRRVVQDQSRSLLDLHLAAIRAAVAQERERCALICEMGAREERDSETGQSLIDIAAEIRKDPA